jgi:cyclopropane fatty-acyl-phospholipid synthase-like methyltransferase
MERDLALKVAERYANGSRAMRGYVAGKLRADPVASRVVALGREKNLGRVVDIGCGRGQLAVALLESGVASSVRGIDWDGAKVAAARMASRGLDVDLAVGDVRTWRIPPCDTVIVIDVLHYLAEADQNALVVRAAKAASRMVLVRELDPDRGWRSALTRAQEAVTTTFGYNTGERLVYRSIAAITSALEMHGFRTSVEPAWGSTPFANVLVVALREKSDRT